MEIRQAVPPLNLKADDLSLSVDPPVGPAGTRYSCLDASKPLKCSLDLPLNRPLALAGPESRKSPYRRTQPWPRAGNRLPGASSNATSTESETARPEPRRVALTPEAYSTNSRTAILAASPFRIPSLNMRV